MDPSSGRLLTASGLRNKLPAVSVRPAWLTCSRCAGYIITECPGRSAGSLRGSALLDDEPESGRPVSMGTPS